MNPVRNDPNPRRSRASLPLALGLAVGLALCGCSSGGSSGKKPKGGKVTPLSTPCPSGAGTIPATSCQLLRVSSPGNPDINVELRVTEPDPLALPLGTVVLGSGGAGGEFYANLAGGDLLVEALAAAGWRVVDRKWDGGWYTTGTSIRTQSSRYAYLLEWVDENLHQGGLLAATGNSGGSGEVAYTLTSWDQAQLLGAAVLTGGPPMARLDYLCTSQPPPEWPGLCDNLITGGFFTCGTPNCTGPNATVCANVAPNATPAELKEDSLLHSQARTDFDFPVHVAIGTEDCTAASPQALLFASSLTGSVSLEFVPGAPHDLMSTQAGRDAIVNALVSAALPAPAVPAPLVRERVTILDEASGNVTVIERAGRPE